MHMRVWEGFHLLDIFCFYFRSIHGVTSPGNKGEWHDMKMEEEFVDEVHSSFTDRHNARRSVTRRDVMTNKSPAWHVKEKVLEN